MSTIVVLDSTPLGILCHPRKPPHVTRCRHWLSAMLVSGRRVVLPEIADYEVRCEFVRRQGKNALANLDSYGLRLEYLPLKTDTMRLAADLWAKARNAGLPTTSDAALDGDVILAGQAISLGVPVVVATANVGHLSRFVPAALWNSILP